MTQELLTFDQIPVPSEWGSRTFTVGEETIKSWIDIIGDRHPLYVDAAAAKKAGYEGVLAPPGAWPLFILDAILKSIPGRPPGGVHARQELEFGVPIRVGDVLTTTVRIADKYLKRERRYVIQETTTTNQRGEVVLIGRMTSIWGK